MLLRRSKPVKSTPKILLGRTEEQRIVHMPAPVFNGQQGSDTMIIVGMTGTGKSVVTRVVTAQQAMLRPVWVFDWAGRDHYLGRRPNRKPKNLPPGLSPRGIGGFYFYYPIKDDKGELVSRPKMPYEIEVNPNFGKYSYEQLEAMGLGGAAPRNLKNLFENYGPFKDMRTLLNFIERFPTSESQNKAKVKQGTSASMHNKPYKPGDIIRSDSLNALARDLRLNVFSKHVWSMRSNKDVDVERLLRSAKNAVFSFNDKVLARAEIDYTLKKLKVLIDRYPDMPRPFIFIEEAQEVFNDQTLVEFVLVCRKLGIGLALTLPTLEPFNKKETSSVASDTKQWIVGKLKGFNAMLALRFIGHPAAVMIPRLKLNRHTNVREFLYFNGDEDAAYGPFQAFECPQEYNRRV